MENPIEVLKTFLSIPLWHSEGVFEIFKKLEPHIYRENPANSLERFLYIEGTGPDKVVLVAHADTFFDQRYGFPKVDHTLDERDGAIYSINEGNIGLGADDRAGCAILWLLRNSGHSLLITDGEEDGCLGSTWLSNHNPDISERINAHQFMIQVDRRNSRDFKCYEVGTPEFREFIQAETGYTEPDRKSRTDIVELCKTVCGVNFSIGYYDEHKETERLVVDEWLHTLNMLTGFLAKELKRFER